MSFYLLARHRIGGRASSSSLIDTRLSQALTRTQFATTTTWSDGRFCPERTVAGDSVPGIEPAEKRANGKPTRIRSSVDIRLRQSRESEMLLIANEFVRYAAAFGTA